MMTGVTIGGYDSKTTWGLILLDDLIVGTPELKSEWVDIPAADGSLNMSYALTGGEPTFQMREISFSLYPLGMNEQSAAAAKMELMTFCHGRETTLKIPEDPDHYFKGVFSIGEKSGYNLLQIPVTVSAYPYRYKNDLTQVQITVPSSRSGSVTLQNEGRRVIPEFVTTATSSFTVTKGSSTYSFTNGTTSFPQLYLDAGSTTLSYTGNSGAKFTIRYQEARL